jgi:AraC-like DNA-binding protein
LDLDHRADVLKDAEGKRVFTLNRCARERSINDAPEAARLLLEQSRLSMEEIAVETGFGARERMRRAFVRTYGEPPQAIRSEAGPIASI